MCLQEKNKTRGLQLCPVFYFTTQWISNPRCGQNIITLLPKHGSNMVIQMGSSWILINVLWDVPNFILLAKSCSPLSKKWPQCCHFMTQTWSSPGPSNEFFLNLNQCTQGCSMPNLTILCVSHSPLFPRNGQKMALLWPKHGPHMVLTWSFKFVLPES